MAVFGGNWSERASAPRPRVLVVSDLLLCREGVAGGLERSGVLAVAGTAAVADAESHVTVPPEAVLLDVSSAGALALAVRLRRGAPAVPIVGFGLGEGDALACAEAGLMGFVGREGTIEELVAATLAALSGEVRCSGQLAALLCDRVAALARSGSTPAAQPLTGREREVAELVSDGLSNKQIALRLGIGPATVKNHVHAVLEKLQVARRGAVGRGLEGLRTRA